jgi:hypothetical protein
MLILGILRQVERVLRERHCAAATFRPCGHFDPIAGTSTGTAIAAACPVNAVIGHDQATRARGPIRVLMRVKPEPYRERGCYAYLFPQPGDSDDRIFGCRARRQSN